LRCSPPRHGEFDLLFMSSFAFAVVDVGAIVLLVPRQLARNRPEPSEVPMSVRRAASLLIDPEFRGLVAGGAVLALATVSDAFIYLLVQRRFAMPGMAFPPSVCRDIAVHRHALFLADAWPIASGADVFLLGGYSLLATAYAVLILPMSFSMPLFVVVVVWMLGAYYAATEGVLTAMAAARLASSRTGTGLALLTTTLNVSRLASSVLFGTVWTLGGPTLATGGYLALLVAAIIVASFALPADAEPSSGSNAATVEEVTQLKTIRRRPHVLFRNTALGGAYGRLAAVPLSAPDGIRYLTPLVCDRVHATHRAGLCLSASRGVLYVIPRRCIR
jgi:hypothetical protein